MKATIELPSAEVNDAVVAHLAKKGIAVDPGSIDIRQDGTALISADVGHAKRTRKAKAPTKPDASKPLVGVS